MTTALFLESAQRLNPYLGRSFHIVGDFSRTDKYIEVLNGYGKGRMRAAHILTGCNFNIQGATDPTKYYILQALEVWGCKYSYKDFVYHKYNSKGIFKCLIHNVTFEQGAEKHLKGSEGCPVCLNLIRKASNHGAWRASKWEEMGRNSKDFQGFKVYIIKCTNETETFYKVGKTFERLKRRFKDKKCMPYNWELIHEFIGTAEYCTQLEESIIATHKNLKYLPKQPFDGYTECFKEIVNDKIF